MLTCAHDAPKPRSSRSASRRAARPAQGGRRSPRRQPAEADARRRRGAADTRGGGAAKARGRDRQAARACAGAAQARRPASLRVRLRGAGRCPASTATSIWPSTSHPDADFSLLDRSGSSSRPRICWAGRRRHRGAQDARASSDREVEREADPGLLVGWTDGPPRGSAARRHPRCDPSAARLHLRDGCQRLPGRPTGSASLRGRIDRHRRGGQGAAD